MCGGHVNSWSFRWMQKLVFTKSLLSCLPPYCTYLSNSLLPLLSFYRLFQVNRLKDFQFLISQHGDTTRLHLKLMTGAILAVNPGMRLNTKLIDNLPPLSLSKMTSDFSLKSLLCSKILWTILANYFHTRCCKGTEIAKNKVMYET